MDRMDFVLLVAAHGDGESYFGMRPLIERFVTRAAAERAAAFFNKQEIRVEVIEDFMED